MKAHYYTKFVEGGRTFQEDLLIEVSALNEVVRYFILDVLPAMLSIHPQKLFKFLNLFLHVCPFCVFCEKFRTPG